MQSPEDTCQVIKGMKGTQGLLHTDKVCQFLNPGIFTALLTKFYWLTHWPVQTSQRISNSWIICDQDMPQEV